MQIASASDGDGGRLRVSGFGNKALSDEKSSEMMGEVWTRRRVIDRQTSTTAAHVELYQKALVLSGPEAASRRSV
jgi:hypothetical protein